MPTEILMPALSPTMEEGKLAKWLIAEGQAIKPGDIIAEIETDKATMEVEAVDEGKVSKLLVPAGTEGVKVNTPIAVLDGEASSATKSATRSPPLGGEGLGVGGSPTYVVGHVALFADTFNTYFEPENLHAAVAVLTRLGYRVTVLAAAVGERALCCGRTYLSAGLVEQARAEARRVLAAAAPILASGGTVVGLEPSCLLTLRDEFIAMLPGPEAERLASRATLLEEFLAAEIRAGRIKGPIASSKGKVLLHGHCHQKAFGAMPAIQAVLGLVDGLAVETVESSCCGMAGAFGYGADTHQASVAMAELSLLPAVRKMAPATVIAADGFSCRHQIHDGTGRSALHVSRILCDAMEATPARATK